MQGRYLPLMVSISATLGVPFAPLLRAAATVVRAHVHVDGERWACLLDVLASHPTLPTAATPALLDLLSGLVELAKLPEITTDALRPGSGESPEEFWQLLRMRNTLLAAVAVLLDALHGELPADAHMN